MATKFQIFVSLFKRPGIAYNFQMIHRRILIVLISYNVEEQCKYCSDIMFEFIFKSPVSTPTGGGLPTASVMQAVPNTMPAAPMSVTPPVPSGPGMEQALQQQFILHQQQALLRSVIFLLLRKLFIQNFN